MGGAKGSKILHITASWVPSSYVMIKLYQDFTPNEYTVLYGTCIFQSDIVLTFFCSLLRSIVKILLFFSYSWIINFSLAFREFEI